VHEVGHAALQVKIRSGTVLVGAALAGSAGFAAPFVPLACSAAIPEAERTCAADQALVAPPAVYRGTSLPAKHVALTFDDGPGTNTAALSAYLKSRNIRATFFVNGRSAPAHPGVLATIAADGHLLANHTQNHYDLRSTAQFPLTPAGEAALVDELAATDALIAPYVPDGAFLFRAPYGYFDARAYGVLHASAMDKYVGHVDWEIGAQRTATFGADWACWENAPRLSSRQCGDLHLNEIRARGRGIVLMHDADKGNGTLNRDVDVGTGNTLDMVRTIVPVLEAEGYTFVRADEVPAIAAALPVGPAPIEGGADGDADAEADADGGADAAPSKAADSSAEPPPSLPPDGPGDGADPASTGSPAAPATGAPADPCTR